MRRLRLAPRLLTALLVVSAVFGQPAGTAEEYAVYAAVLDEAVGGASFVVLDTAGIGGRPANLDRELSFPVEFTKLVTPDLVSDFKNRNREPSTFTRFPERPAVTLIGEKERSQIFAAGLVEGWTVFNQKYPGGSGITTLSRVGFNQTRDAAIVYVKNARQAEAGTAAYYLFAKKDGKWSVVCQTRSRMM